MNRNASGTSFVLQSIRTPFVASKHGSIRARVVPVFRATSITRIIPTTLAPYTVLDLNPLSGVAEHSRGNQPFSRGRTARTAAAPSPPGWPVAVASSSCRPRPQKRKPGRRPVTAERTMARAHTQVGVSQRSPKGHGGLKCTRGGIGTTARTD